MEITTSTQPESQPASLPPKNGLPEAGRDNLSSDFETFLRMLTVQMQNQDPLNPVESSDFAVQLATFSNVEQAVRTNDLLVSLTDQLGASGLSQLSNWVGMEARAQMPVVFDGAPISLTVRPDRLADQTQLVVRDAGGTVVQRQDVPQGAREIQWAGVGDNGAPLPAGSYDITTESFSQGAQLGSQPVEVHSRIVEARNDAGTTVLIMRGGQEVAADKILSLRAADQP